MTCRSVCRRLTSLYAYLGTDEPTDLLSVLGEVAAAWAASEG